MNSFSGLILKYILTNFCCKGCQAQKCPHQIWKVDPDFSRVAFEQQSSHVLQAVVGQEVEQPFASVPVLLDDSLNVAENLILKIYPNGVLGKVSQQKKAYGFLSVSNVQRT